MPTAGKSSFLVGLFLICMCCLMLQIIETIVSVVAYYYLAFFAIGMAMFGIKLPFCLSIFEISFPPTHV